MGRIKFTALAVSAGIAILSAPASADTKAGVDAWTRGDFVAAVQLWQADAAKGDADALFNLGQAYRLGKGVTQNLAKAEDLFGRASALGHLQASDNYGLLLFQRGEQAKAVPFITAAAGRGDPRAQYLLGIAHFNGQLVTKDWVRAYALVSLAQQQGIGPATAALQQMDGHIPIEQRQQAVALAAQLHSQADATRTRQLAAADLGTNVPAATPRPAVTQPPRVASASPATAGADYARPAAVPLPPPRPVAVSVPAPRTPPLQVSVPRPAATPTPAATPAASGPWRIQLGAFGVASNADALWAKVRARPEVAGHPRVNAKSGAIIRLQAGGFASQAAAKGACTKLVASGYTCVATLN